MNKTTEALKLAEEALLGSGYYDTTQQRKALAAIREALAEQEKQEPVAVISESAIGLVKLHSNGACLPFGTQLYAAPVSAEAIRAEALEEAAKLCDRHTAAELIGSDAHCALKELAAAIRGLK